MSSVVAFMRAARGTRACKFPVRRKVQLDLFFAGTRLENLGRGIPAEEKKTIENIQRVRIVLSITDMTTANWKMMPLSPHR
jgi:hypothetical protein